jgi:uncharacterized protein
MSAVHLTKIDRTRVILALEFGVLFFVLPTLFMLRIVRPPLILFLCIFAAACLVYLLRRQGFERRRLWNAAAIPRHIGWSFAVFAASAGVMSGIVYVVMPERFMEMPLSRPQLWIVIMIFYPLFSVYPQEIIFRVFMFERYRDLFPTRWAMIGASAVAFGYGHIIFESAISVLLTLLGGILFAKTYYESRSTLMVSIEHALYGCFVFTVGLGIYFYTGAVR